MKTAGRLAAPGEPCDFGMTDEQYGEMANLIMTAQVATMNATLEIYYEAFQLKYGKSTTDIGPFLNGMLAGVLEWALRQGGDINEFDTEKLKEGIHQMIDTSFPQIVHDIQGEQAGATQEGTA